MMRPLTILILLGAAGAGLHLYSVKQSTAVLERELRDILRQTEAARERSQVLRAEWALLNQPDRLRRVVEQHLTLEPMAPSQFVRLTDMDRRLPERVAFAGAPSLFADPAPVEGRETLLAGRARAAAVVAAAAPVAPAPVSSAPVSPAPVSPAALAPAALAAAAVTSAPIALASIEPPAQAPAPRPHAPPPPTPMAQPAAAERPLAPPVTHASPPAASVQVVRVAAVAAPAPARPAPAPRAVTVAVAAPRAAPSRPALGRDADTPNAAAQFRAPAPAVSALGGMARSDQPMLPPPVPYGGGGLISSANAATLYGSAAR
ncbi:hypothetical protein C8P66_108166 [Humitalea rosea]|uniref:Cell division protein FtsL n=1 Tax=Humitalea rosea TaxID=990373 RepID=A0A2W7IJ48_9PROT|nr:hypothetical protein [Humitalea rosea]PZW46885.1 hypothetical protein C8P66_108166 [Humitalea rosea]